MVTLQGSGQTRAETVAPPKRRQRNLKVLAGVLLIPMAMGTLVYYSVPLYQLFCDVTGFGGTTRAAQAAPTTVIDREITVRSEEHTSELQSLMRISYAVFCLKKKNKQKMTQQKNTHTTLNK